MLNPKGLVLALREVGGTFDFNKVVPRAGRLTVPLLPSAVPLIEHRGSVSGTRELDYAAIKLTSLFTRDGRLRHADGDALRSALALGSATRVIVSGIDQDDDIEAWWALGLVNRRWLISAFQDFGIILLTVPNFSLALNEPRPTQLHAISRMAIAHQEFVSGGIPSALHIGANTERDYARLAGFVSARDEITHVSADFTTGPARAERRDFHLKYLRALAIHVGRPLHLVLKGRVDAIPPLMRAFESVTYIDTTAFSKTMRRKRLVIDAAGHQRDCPAPTRPEESLDDLWEENWVMRQAFLSRLRGASGD